MFGTLFLGMLHLIATLLAAGYLYRVHWTLTMVVAGIGIFFFVKWRHYYLGRG